MGLRNFLRNSDITSRIYRLGLGCYVEGKRGNSTMFYLVCEILCTLNRALFKLD